MVVRHGIEYYITTREPLAADTLFVDTGKYHIKVQVGTWRSDTINKKYHLLSEYEGKGSLVKQAEYYKPAIDFRKATLRTVDNTLIDSLIITDSTKTFYYLNGERVSPTDSIGMNEYIPFIPLEAPKR